MKKNMDFFELVPEAMDNLIAMEGFLLRKPV